MNSKLLKVLYLALKMHFLKTWFIFLFLKKKSSQVSKNLGVFGEPEAFYAV